MRVDYIRIVNSSGKTIRRESPKRVTKMLLRGIVRERGNAVELIEDDYRVATPPRQASGPRQSTRLRIVEGAKVQVLHKGRPVLQPYQIACAGMWPEWLGL